MVGILAYRPSCPGFIPSIPETFLEKKFVHVGEVNQWRSLEESRQWLENVDETHLVLASGKLVLQERRGRRRK